MLVKSTNKKHIDWDRRFDILMEEVEDYRKSSGYECIIGVSGVKIAITKFIL